MVTITKIPTLQLATITASDLAPQSAPNDQKGDLFATGVDQTIQSQTMNQQRSEKWVFQEGMDVRYVLSGDQIVEKNPPKYVLDRYADAQMDKKKGQVTTEVA